MKKFLFVFLSVLLGNGLQAQNSVNIGSSTNAYGILLPQQNQVFVDPALNIVGLIYRQNITIHGGTSGSLRYSVSTDGGASWATDLGPVNPTLTYNARYPQAFLHNPTGNTTTAGTFLVWSAPSLPTNFDGHVNGALPLVTANPVASSENYQFLNTSTNIQAGLCESTNGTFWTVENATSNDTVFIDTVNVYKGTFGSGDVTWVKQASLYSPHSRSFDGAPHLTRPNIAFSPDGQTGYIVFLGDINAADSTYNPVIYKSTNGGTSWSTANELKVDQIPGIGDSIKQFLFDTGTAIESATEVAPAFEYDITVDAASNLHIFTTLCAVERRDTLGVVVGAKQYSVYSGYPKNAVDIYTTDGGTSWTSLYVAQVNLLRTTIPVSSGTLSADNYSQISRTKDGNIIFYSWSDTDTILHQGSTTNDAPNTFIAGFNTTNGKRTCWKQITGVANEDFAVTPTMAPYVLEGSVAGPEYTLPIVTQEISGDALSAVNLYYVGKGAKFCDEDFKDPAAVDLSWVSQPLSGLPGCYNYVSCFAASVEDEQTITFNLFPNPATDLINVYIQQGEDIKEIYIVNSVGQIIRTIKPGSMVAGSIFNIDVNQLATGVYTLNMSTNAKTYSKKFTVVR